MKKGSKGTVSTRPSSEVAAPCSEDTQRRESNSKLYLQMEEPIRDAALMAEVVQDLMIGDNLEIKFNEHTVWAVFHLCDMMREMQNIYRGKPADQREVAS